MPPASPSLLVRTLVGACLLAAAALGMSALPACSVGPSASGAAPVAGVSTATFRNPFVPATPGVVTADPSIVLHDGWYHWAASLGARGIGIARSRRLQDLAQAPMVVVYRPEPGAADAQHVWAPELVRLDGRWWLYYAADDGRNERHRMFVLSADSDDAQGAWTRHGQLQLPGDFWAIDGTVLQAGEGARYFVWSGWQTAEDDHRQHLYITAMSDPLTFRGGRVRLSSPDLPWEASPLRGEVLHIEEGPEVLQHDGTLSLVFSAAGSWSADYALGLLVHTGGNVLDPSTWVKRPQPIFESNPAGGTWGVGHPTFTTSPDHREDWIVYHGMADPAAGWRGRSLRAQPFKWNADGTPDFGRPDADGTERAAPSGSMATAGWR